MQTTEIFEETRELNMEFTARPLEHKGLNKHFINLVSADVFKPKTRSFFGLIKDLFIAAK